MTKLGLLAAVPALALCAPALAQPQSYGSSVGYPPPAAIQPMPAPNPPAPNPPTPNPNVTIHTNPATGETVETTVTPPRQIPPPTSAALVPSVPTPGFVWIPGHYNWDPARGQYIWLVGQYMQPPHTGARWVGGHWRLEANNWVWIDGQFN